MILNSSGLASNNDGNTYDEYMISHGSVNFQTKSSTFVFPEPIYIPDFNQTYDAVLINIYRKDSPGYVPTGSDNYYTMGFLSAVKEDSYWNASAYYRSTTYMASSSQNTSTSSSSRWLSGSGTRFNVEPGLESVTLAFGNATIVFMGEYNYIVFHMKRNANL